MSFLSIARTHVPCGERLCNSILAPDGWRVGGAIWPPDTNAMHKTRREANADRCKIQTLVLRLQIQIQKQCRHFKALWATFIKNWQTFQINFYENFIFDFWLISERAWFLFLFHDLKLSVSSCLSSNNFLFVKIVILSTTCAPSGRLENVSDAFYNNISWYRSTVFYG